MKFDELPTTDRSGRELAVDNAIVTSVSLSIADHGCLSGWLFTEFGSGSCGFGGYMLGRRDENNVMFIKGYAAEFIVRCAKVCGVEEWEKIEGQPIRVLHEGLSGGIVAIGHFLKDEWFCPRKEWENA